MDRLVNKEIIPIQAQILKGAKGEFPNEDSLEKIDSMISSSLQLIEEFLEDYDDIFKEPRCQLKRPKFKYSRIAPKREQLRPKDGYRMIIFVEDIEDKEKMNAFAQGLRCEFHIPQTKLDRVQSNLEQLQMSDIHGEDRVIYEYFLNYFMHELLHMFGAWHDKKGVMSGVVKLFDDNDDFRLIDELDNISARIVSESLYSQIYAPPFGAYTYDKKRHTIRITSDVEVTSLVFIKDSHYTNRFFFTKSSVFQCLLPEDCEWDTMLVQYHLGGILLYKKDDVLRNNRDCRIRSR